MDAPGALQNKKVNDKKGQAAQPISKASLRERLEQKVCDCAGRRHKAESANAASCFRSFLNDSALFDRLFQYVTAWQSLDKLEQDQFAS